MNAPGGFRGAFAATKNSQKSMVGAPGWSRWVNRPLGRVFAATAHTLGATPDQVTALSTVVTLSGVAAIAVVRPTWGSAVVIAVVLVLGYALDSADGQLARLRGGGSSAGEWLDHVSDAVKTSGLHLAVAICWFRVYDLPSGWLLVPLGFTLVAAVFFFTLVLSESLRRLRGAGSSRRAPAADGSAPWLRSVLVLPADYGVLCVSMVLLPATRVFATVYTALFAFAVLFLVVGCRNWYLELRAADRARVRP